jgi:hypothetical protein
VGTGVKAPWVAHEPGKPILTDLSGQDVWALHQQGFEPCGFLFEFCRYHVWHVMNPPGLDPEFTDRLKREGGATGELRISLLWNNTNDLDLHVIPPSGEELSFSHKKSQCGGELDVDMNVNGGSASKTPIENVYWAHGSAPKGHYKVRVKQFTCRQGQQSTDFRVEVVAGGQVTHYQGTVDGGGTVETACEFDYQGLQPYEIPLATEAVDKARAIAAAKLLEQASFHRADYVVGSDLKLSVRETSCGFAGCELNDLDVEVSWFGTGIRHRAGERTNEKGIPPLILSMLPLGRRKDLHLEEDSDEDIQVSAEEAEEAAEAADEANTFATEVATEAAERARGGE